MPSEKVNEHFDIFTNGVYLIGTTIGIGAVIFSSRLSIWKEVDSPHDIAIMKSDLNRFLVYFFIWISIILFFMYHRFHWTGVLYALGIGTIFFVWFVGNYYTILSKAEQRVAERNPPEKSF